MKKLKEEIPQEITSDQEDHRATPRLAETASLFYSVPINRL